MSDSLAHDLQARVVMGIGAHADDIDFTAAGTIARLAAGGAEIYYLVVTDGSKGTADRDLDGATLAAQRRQEQLAAAQSLGVKDVFFLDYEDGRLESTLELKRDIVRYIRRCRPDLVMCFDPSMLYSASRNFINHADHRACGMATIDAIYPMARDHLSLPELLAEGLQPHKVTTLLLNNFDNYNYVVDVSAQIDKKMAVFSVHASQAAMLDDKQARHRQYAAELGQKHGYEYAESFVKIDIPVNE